MKFDEVLNESFQLVTLKYTGSRDDYKIHDPSPHVLVIDDNYNVDGNGDSVLGLNLNYYDGDLKEILKAINHEDNKAGFFAFNTKMKIKKLLAKDKLEFEKKEVDERIRRYKNFIENFPYMAKFIRRYKKEAITSRKRK